MGLMMFIGMGFMLIFGLIMLIMNKFFALTLEIKSPFECGFDPKQNDRPFFSLRFFIISIIFLIFDLELTLILPFPLLVSMIKFNIISLFLLIYFFILMTTIIEWNQGALNWFW